MTRLAAAPVQAQEPLTGTEENHEAEYHRIANALKKAGFEFDPYNEDEAKIVEIIMELFAPVQPVAVPDGWKLVPVEPDCMMAHAVLLDSRSNDSYLGSEPRELWIADRVYRTMLAAAPAAPAAQGDAKEDRAAQRERLNKKVLAMPDGMPDVIGPVLANTRCASCNSFNALHMANCGYCGAAIAAKAAS